MRYFIQVNLSPESFNRIPHYFWCILECHHHTVSNCGHGWSLSINQAITDAQNYYNKIIKNIG